MEYPNYNPQSDNRPLSDEELSDLDDLLAELPSDGAMNIEALDGYLAGLLLSPKPLAEQPGADWLPLVWGGDGEGNAPFASGKQKKRVMMLVLRHLQSIAWQWRQKPELWEPIFSVAEVDDDEELTDAEDWALGFMSAVDLDQDAWAPLFEQQAALLAPMRILGSDESELSEAERAQLADPHQRDELSRSIMDAALQLFAQRSVK